MSTRCNIVIEFGSTRLYVYRHHDGYLASAGVDIAAKLADANGNASKFVGALLAESYDATSYDPTPRPVYEVTCGIHGDVEYVYRVKFSWTNTGARGGAVKVGFVGGNKFRIPREQWDASCRRVKLGSVDAFTAECKTEEVAMLKRIDALKAVGIGGGK